MASAKEEMEQLTASVRAVLSENDALRARVAYLEGRLAGKGLDPEADAVFGYTAPTGEGFFPMGVGTPENESEAQNA